MSSPKVLVTTKPHPSTNPLLIMGQVVAGGAEASPNGFGNLRPHISTERSTSSMGVWNLGRRRSSFGMEESPAIACVELEIHVLSETVCIGYVL